MLVSELPGARVPGFQSCFYNKIIACMTLDKSPDFAVPLL
jgi:hypothetical protein